MLRVSRNEGLHVGSNLVFLTIFHLQVGFFFSTIFKESYYQAYYCCFASVIATLAC